MTENRENEANNSTEVINITSEMVAEYSNNPLIIKFIKRKFKRLNHVSAIKLINLLLRSATKIHANEISKSKSFLQYNMGKFDNETKLLKLDTVKSLHLELMGLLIDMGKDLPMFDKINKNEDSDCYKLDKNTVYAKIRRLICDEGGEVDLKYDFDTPDMEIENVKNKEGLQRSNIQILSKGIKFDYPIEYRYVCPRCNHRASKKSYETVSTKTAYTCEGIYQYASPQTGEPKAKICGIN